MKEVKKNEGPKRLGDRLDKGKGKARVEETHVVDEHTSDEDVVSLGSESDETRSWYDWLGDTCASSHVTNRKENFTSFRPVDKTKVRGVGNSEIKAEGR